MKIILDNVGVTAKYVVSGIAAGSLLLNQSPLPLYYTVCALLNSLFGKVMKRIIKDPRPAKSPKPGYGMPSSHTTAISYFSYVVLYTAPYFVPQPSLRWLLAAVVVAYGISACYWRIVSHLHTPLQILLGGCLGLCSGYLATSQEASIQAYTAAHPWSPGSLFAVKLLVCLAIVPVVFKHEIKWLRSLVGGGGGGVKAA